MPTNFTKNPETFLKKARPRDDPPSATPSATEPITPAPSVPNTTADKTLFEYSVPTVADVPIGPVVNMGDANFKLKTGLIMMVQASLFHRLPSEDANAYLQHFLELRDTIVMKDVTPEIIKLHLFLFSLLGRVKQWFYKDWEAVNTWNKCSTTFLAKFFPMGKTNALRGRISNF